MIRLAKKMSQEDFSELLGISVDFLSLIERGINAPSFENLEAFSTQLGIPVHELFVFELPEAAADMPKNDRISF